MMPRLKTKSDPEEVDRVNSNNEWLNHLMGEFEAPLAVKQKEKRKVKISSKQQQAIRSK